MQDGFAMILEPPFPVVSEAGMRTDAAGHLMPGRSFDQRMDWRLRAGRLSCREGLWLALYRTAL